MGPTGGFWMVQHRDVDVRVTIQGTTEHFESARVHSGKLTGIDEETGRPVEIDPVVGGRVPLWIGVRIDCGQGAALIEVFPAHPGKLLGHGHAGSIAVMLWAEETSIRATLKGQWLRCVR